VGAGPDVLTTDRFLRRCEVDCSCTVMHPDGDSDALGWSERVLTAGKPHVCGECQGAISKGEEFVFGSIFRQDDIHNYKVCLSCKAIINQFFRDGCIIGSMWDYLDEYFDCHWVEDLPSSCISQLKGSALHRVCDLLQKYQEGV